MKLAIVGLLLVSLAGSIACQNYPEPKDESGSMSGWYVVGAGETLSSISVLFYGDAQYWYHLRDVNVEMGNLENSALHSSDRIFIPNAKYNTNLLNADEAGVAPHPHPPSPLPLFFK